MQHNSGRNCGHVGRMQLTEPNLKTCHHQMASNSASFIRRLLPSRRNVIEINKHCATGSLWRVTCCFCCSQLEKLETSMPAKTTPTLSTRKLHYLIDVQGTTLLLNFLSELASSPLDFPWGAKHCHIRSVSSPAPEQIVLPSGLIARYNTWKHNKKMRSGHPT